jgi:adenine deaminase
LQSFLAVFDEGSTVLLKEADFYDLCYAYLARVAAQNVVHAEIFFDPQHHLSRGIAMADIIGGIARAQADASEQFSISSGLILCFIRELSAESPMEALEAYMPLHHPLVGVGLDLDERGNPPVKCDQVFARARLFGLRVTVHCDIDQEDTLDNIRQAIGDIGVDRIDHGGNILLSPELMRLARERLLAFTICPTFGCMLLGGVDIVCGMLDRLEEFAAERCPQG